MKKFDSTVKLLKHQVLTEIARAAFDDNLLSILGDIPKKIMPGPHPTHRCCVFKERAILAERVKMAMGGNRENPNVVEVLDIACDGCPVDGYNVTNICRGCLSHNCLEVCPKDAISLMKDQTSHIDKTKCINCGLCAKACPYSAIINFIPPCEIACQANAIKRNSDGVSVIDNNKCVSCGACIVKCPFGAINDKSYILNVIDMLKRKEKIYAICAPSIVGQFEYATLGQLITAIKKLGFCEVREVALGADMVAKKEAQELAKKHFLTTSCCPSFVKFVNINFPKMADAVSHNLSPMGEIARFLKEKDPDAKVVFIGPCVAKKMEYQKPEVAPWVDSVITYEELQALIESKDIVAEELEETPFNEASYFGRIFARSGGVSAAVTEAMKEQNLDFQIKACACSGLSECKRALTKAAAKVGEDNLIEGMACVGGCVAGAGNLHYNLKNKINVDKHAAMGAKSIEEAIEKSS